MLEKIKSLNDASHFSEDLRLRISSCLWSQMVVLTDQGLNPFRVIETIRTSENDGYDGAKRATQFRKSPLKGLWHKHFVTGREVAMNVRGQWPSHRLRQIIHELRPQYKDTNEGNFEFSEMISQVIVNEYWTRKKEGKLSGNWLIFAVVDDAKYYLCLSQHTDVSSFTDADLVDFILKYCSISFPKINRWFG